MSVISPGSKTFAQLNNLTRLNFATTQADCPVMDLHIANVQIADMQIADMHIGDIQCVSNAPLFIPIAKL
ncbi:MAG: hypothetical protein KME15_21030 [Drouetiella hepatica Uher 2000/2452]|uniref:Uncharacterized protein n=1 Tax=Drouetiella hepatica Uher 2000/2452 TaxID=904376 RepID=A0A951QEC1_9CYAN|nr:hypothetical protein [Drouetiella hepatica Uher 2000/2452]